MEFKEAVKIALQSLWANKLRSVLTLLGVVIGVASVIAVVTLVNGANTYVTTKFASYGADVFTVSKMPQIITSPEDYQRYQKRKNILFPDLSMSRRTASTASELARSRRRRARSCGDTVHNRYQHPWVYVADACVAEPEHRAGARVHGGG